jgi:ribose transport system permease protein
MIAAASRLPAELAFLVFTRTAFVAALVTLLAIASPHFLTSDNMVILLRQAALQFLLSAGLTLVVITGGIDLSVGAVLGLSACVGAALIAKGYVIGGIVAALLVGLACGLVNGAMVAYVGIPAFIATYGMLWVAHGLGYVFMKGEVIHGFDPAFRALGAGFLAGIPLPVLIAAALLVALHVVLHLTKFGRALYAMGGNPVAARLVGIPTKNYLVGVYGLSGLLAGFAGLVVIARVNAADSGTGEELLLAIIAAVVLGGTSLFGGVGGIMGTAVGALILALVVNGMNMLGIPTFWQAFAMGAIVILAVLADVSFKRRIS